MEERARTKLRSFPRKRESSTGSPLARGRAEKDASLARAALAISALILRSPPKAGVSKDATRDCPWFETRSFGALLTMRRKVAGLFDK